MTYSFRIAWKVSSPDGEFSDCIFNDWFQLCAYLMKQRKNASFPLLIDRVVVMDD